jgi:alkylation response protein AidB-like acyl-CoA dehydrogenase
LDTVTEWFVRTPEQREHLRSIGDLADRFALVAAEVDEKNSFSFDAITALKTYGYHAFTVPREYGGKGISIYEFVLYQERLAQGDAATALAIGWHLGTLYDLAQKRQWREPLFAELCHEVVAKGSLINRAASETATGSPSWGGKPQTRARKAGNGYIITGRKVFTSLSPVLNYFLVTATEEDTGEVAEFLIPRDSAGVDIEPTWNMLGMRGTASHDLVLQEVFVPAEARVHQVSEKNREAASPFLLHIPACYLGIALAARREALIFASIYQPNSLQHPILSLPGVQRAIGRMELELSAARHYLYSVAARWDQQQDASSKPELAAVKTFAVQTALSVVDQAMRIVGIHGLAHTHPLQRLYRDVRFGLHNPPNDEQTIQLLAKRAIEREGSLCPITTK